MPIELSGHIQLKKQFQPMWDHPQISMLMLNEDNQIVDVNNTFRSFLQGRTENNDAQGIDEILDNLDSHIVNALTLEDPAPRTIALSLPFGQKKFSRIILSENPKLVQLVLHRENARDMALLQSLPDMYFVLDEKGWIKEFHAPDTSKLGIKPEEMRNRSMKELYPPDRFEDLIKPVREALKTNEVITTEYHFDLPDGTQQHFISRFVRIQGTRMVLLLAQDVTTLKLAEEQLSSSLKELERSNKELEQFAYVASHDLQEPIRLIAGYTDLLSKSLPQESIDDKSRMYMDFILQSTDRMKALINGLLEYSRLGNQVLKTEKVNLDDLLNALRFQFERNIQNLNAQLEIDALPIKVDCNPVQMGRLFQNLISNALKFRKKGVAPKIHIHYKDQGDTHYFAVADNGIGIKEEQFDRLFVIFSRLNLREKYEGNGLGLTIVKRIVDRHHGKVWVSSIYGEGTTIHFTIPKIIPED